MTTSLRLLIEQLIEEELEDLEEQNALAGGAVCATSTGSGLAHQKKHKDKTGNGTRHDLLWAGDEVTSNKKSVVRSEQLDQSKTSSEQELIKTIKSVKDSGEVTTTLDALIKVNPSLKGESRIELRNLLDKLSAQGLINYKFSLVCGDKKLFEGKFSDYAKMSKIKLAWIKKQCDGASKMTAVDSIQLK